MADSGDGIYIKFGANSADFEQGCSRTVDSSKTAKTAIDDFTQKVRGLNDALRTPAFQQMELSVKSLKSQFSTFGDAVKEVNRQIATGLVSAESCTGLINELKEAYRGGSEAGQKFSLATAGSTREIIVLAHEMVSGNFSRIPGSLMVLAERMGSLSTTTLGVGAAIGALGFSVYELVTKLREANEALELVRGTMASMGNSAQYSTNTVKQALNDLYWHFDLGSKAAGKVEAAIQKIPNATPAIKTALRDLLPAFVQLGADGTASEEEVAKGVEDLTRVLSSGPAAVKSFLAANQMLSAEFAKQLDEANGVTGAYKAQDVAVQALTQRVGDYGETLKRYNLEQASNVPLMGWNRPSQPEKKPKANEHSGAAADTGELQSYENEQHIVSDTKAVVDEVKATWQGGKADLDALIAQMWQNVIDQNKYGGNTLEQLQRELLTAQKTARESAAQDAISSERLKISQIQAVSNGSQQQLIEAEIASSRRLLQNKNLTTEERRNIEIQLNQQIGQLNTEQAASELRLMQEKVTAARLGSAERVELVRQEVELVKRLYGEDTTQYKAALQAKVEAEKARKAEVDAVAKAELDTNVTLAKLRLQGQKDALEAEVQAGNMTAEQKIEILRRIADEEYRLELQSLERERAMAEEGTRPWQQAQDKILVLSQQYNNQLDRMAEQQAAAQKKAAEATTSVWERAMAPIERAWDTSLTGMIMGTQTLRQAVARMGQSILAEEISADTKWLMHRLITGKAIEAADKSTASTGLLAWAFSEQAKTAATRTATTARTAANATENSSFLGKIGSTLAEWLGLETSKTAATTAGVAERGAEETAATTESIVAAKLEAAAEIPSYASIGAAAAMASVAAIPFVGWAMAPGVGAEHFAVAMSFLASASAAGGWDRVPYDGAITELHKDEMVLPASIASPLRGIVQAIPHFGLPSGFGQSNALSLDASTATGGDTHHHYSPTLNVQVSNSGSRSVSPDDVARAATQALRNGHRDFIKELRKTV